MQTDSSILPIVGKILLVVCRKSAGYQRPANALVEPYVSVVQSKRLPYCDRSEAQKTKTKEEYFLAAWVL